MANRLLSEISPYLQQHSNNPVDWYPWGKEALNKAAQEDKPIFLSIGYTACHWCHVMAHESFEDPGTAALLNANFVNIKVDREERPDLDSIYMQAVVAMTGQGGWPMSVFITPDGKPFFGGTYFPPTRRHGMASFGEVLEAIARLWREDRKRLLENSERLLEHLISQIGAGSSSGQLDSSLLKQACMKLAQAYDWKNGGWGQAPKFPQPLVIDFLLQQATRGDRLALDMAVHALRAMASGGMYDVVGGGFARYSVDNSWLTPHFEKMLYDNALLGKVYLHAWKLTDDPYFRQICEATLDFVLREMTHPWGGFYSSLDADSEGEEGKFYTWKYQEVIAAFANSDDLNLYLAAYGIIPDGNFEGKTILKRALSDDQISEMFGLPAGSVESKLAALNAVMLAERTKRIRPQTDDKILVFWNALMLSTFAEAARTWKRNDYLAAATSNATFLLEHLYRDDRLLRVWRAPAEGVKPFAAQHNAYLEDYASLILALLDLYACDLDEKWYRKSVQLAGQMVVHFSDSEGGFFDTRDDHEILLLRPKDLQDNATPSGNALAALALLKLSFYCEKSVGRSKAEEMLFALQSALAQYPTAFPQWLQVADFAIGPVFEIAIIGGLEQPATLAMLEIIWKMHLPRAILACSDFPPPPGSPDILSGRPKVDELPTAYVCKAFVCRQPVSTPADLLKQLEEVKVSGLKH
jgi:hypothetical protein